MSMALDIGSNRFRALHCAGRRLAARTCRAVYSLLPDSPSRREWLDKANVQFATCGDRIVIVGDNAEELANLFDIPIRPLLPEGLLPDDDPLARQILGAAVDMLLPPVHESAICTMTLPTAATAASGARGTLDFFARVVSLRGYRPITLSPGLAVVLAELVDAAFTGLGIVFGDSGCEALLAHNGRELVRCRHPNSVVVIDEETGAISSRPTRQAIEEFFMLVSQTMESHDDLSRIGSSMTIACAGGVCMEAEFVELVKDAIEAVEFPVPLAGVRFAKDPLFSIARGALIHGELEERDSKTRVA